jgi:hypothetical protein
MTKAGHNQLQMDLAHQAHLMIMLFDIVLITCMLNRSLKSATKPS